MVWVLLTSCTPSLWAQPSLLSSQAFTGSSLTVGEVAPGVFVHLGVLDDWALRNQGDVANLSLVVGTRCSIVVDSGGTPEMGQAWLEAVRRATSVPICYVVNTHAHPDHIVGNGAFEKLATPPQFVASAHFAAMLAARAPYYRSALQRDFGVALEPAVANNAGLAVNHTLNLDLGGPVVTLQAWPTAHTDNDLTVWDGLSHTLIAGDLLFAQHVPVLDGSLCGWLCALEKLRPLDVAVLVPGHGPISHNWPAALDAQRGYLQGLLQATRSAIDKLWTLQQAVERIGMPAGSGWALGDIFQRRNVTAAYAELEWEEEPSGALPCQP
jgi:quinoprotein relay system zinc metallohydrolase 2